MDAGPHDLRRRGRKRWAWVLYGAAAAAMTVGLFLPSYGVDFGFRTPSAQQVEPAPLPSEIFVGWQCAWIVTTAWEEVLNGGFDLGMGPYHSSLIWSYLPINALFVVSPFFLWLAGRTRRLGWVLRVIYSLIVLQVLAWWVMHVVEDSGGDTVMIGYWFWLASFTLLAAAFWAMPGTPGAEAANPDVGAPS